MQKEEYVALRTAIYEAVPTIKTLIPEEELARDPATMTPNEAHAASLGNLYHSLGESGWRQASTTAVVNRRQSLYWGFNRRQSAYSSGHGSSCQQETDVMCAQPMIQKLGKNARKGRNGE